MSDSKPPTASLTRRFDWRLLPCTVTQYLPCQTIPCLFVWNRYLSRGRWRLGELPGTRGKLLLATFRRPHFTECRREANTSEAYRLVGWLLRAHRCVVTLFVFLASIAGNEELLGGVLHTAFFLKRLTIFSENGHRHIHDLICAAIASLQHLEELEIKGYVQCGKSLWTALSILLRRSKSLTVLRFPRCALEADGAEELVAALMSNLTLKELSLNASILSLSPVECRAAFAEYLKSNKVLTTLMINAHHTKGEDALKWILEGLLGNKNVSDVCLENFLFQTDHVNLVSRILAENAAFSAFHLISCRQSPLEVDHDSWHAVLIENDALQEVTLPAFVWKPNAWELFFNALPRKSNLRKLTVEIRSTDWCHVRQACEVLRKSGGSEKQVCLRFKQFLAPAMIVLSIIECKALSEISLVTPGNQSHDAISLADILRYLAVCRHVSRVRLRLQTDDQGGELSLSIAHYIRTTSSVKELQLIECRTETGIGHQEVVAKDSPWAVIIQSLLENRSLRRLRIHATSLNQQDVVRLADVIKASRNICRTLLSGFSTIDLALFAETLSASIADNYNILSVILDGYVASTEGLCDILDTMSRNSVLITRAADFLNRTRADRCCAEAFERMSRHSALLEEVAKLRSIDEADAAVLVRKERMMMEGIHEFMRLAGVVKERVVCCPRGDGAAQLDDLNEDCWRTLRKYLKLEDIKHVLPQCLRFVSWRT